MVRWMGGVGKGCCETTVLTLSVRFRVSCRAALKG